MENLNNYHIILASQSPRRQELLKGLDIQFSACMIDIEEVFPAHLQAEEIPIYLAELKTKAFPLSAGDNKLIIAADTIVWHNGKMLGKPANETEAKKMLQALSGDIHEVFTGVCLCTAEKKVSFSATTKVYFAPLSSEEIDYYVSHYKPYDKAGAYGVQEWIGFAAVERIEGSYFNVMGMPIQQLYTELKKF